MIEFRVMADRLHTAAEWAARALSTKPIEPVLHGLILEATETTLTLAGYNHELYATSSVDAIQVEPGKVLVPGRLLVDVLKVAGRVDLIATVENSRLIIRGGRARWTLPLLPVEDFPPTPDPGEIIGEINAEDLRAAVQRMLPAVGTDPVLPALTCVKVETRGGTLTMAATDRYRLAVANLPWTPKSDFDYDLLVPADLLAAVTRIPARDDTLTLTAIGAGGVVGISARTSSIVGRQVEAKYPDWRKLLPELPRERRVIVSVADLLHALDQISPLDRLTQEPWLTITVDAGHVVIAAGDKDDGAAETAIAAESHGDPITVKIKPRYLKNAIKGAESDQIVIHFGATPNHPLLVHSEDPDSYQHLVMPQRSV